jgi:Domain of unknown function (DUF929)
VGRKTNKQRRQQHSTTAREKAAIARAEQVRAEQRRRATTVLSAVVVLAVLAALGVFIGINHKGKNNASGDRVTADSSVLKSVYSVKPATLQTVGAGSDTLLPKAISDPPLTSGGKPEVLFIGAEFCPFCAAERWSLIQALSRFGTFSNLSQISSSSTDTDPNTPTFTFYKSSYTSKYLTFRSVEDETRTQASLENPTTAENKIWVKYDGNPPGFPFLDYGGKFVQTSQSFDPAILSGLTQTQVAAQLNDPTSTIAKAIDGGANMTTATICTMIQNRDTKVCLQPTITNLQSQIGA